MTAPVLLPDSIELEDIAPPCEFGMNCTCHSRCDDSATWLMVAKCGCLWLFCDAHKELQMKIGIDGIRSICSQHRVKFDGSPWTTVERL